MDKKLYRLLNAKFIAIAISLALPGMLAAKGGYCVIDLSEGCGATNYPVSYLDAEPVGGWTDVHKTDLLVLRRVEPGRFVMGSPESECGRMFGEDPRVVSLTRPYYLGVFEVTQRQWERVTGKRPSWFSNPSCWGMRAVEQTSYEMICGSEKGSLWPDSDAVDKDSFLGLLRLRTGLRLDLPTEAQWEYACRAGTVEALADGRELRSLDDDSSLSVLSRIWSNGGSGYARYCDVSAATSTVGAFSPNAWGFYDMHGNVQEWCRDWWSVRPEGGNDPKGPTTGVLRAIRGGAWNRPANCCRSAARNDNAPPSLVNGNVGFRLALLIP